MSDIPQTGLPALPAIGAAIKYNPHLWNAEELRAIFVARKNELQQIINSLSQTDENTVPQHILITGHRGMGKSTLLQRVALAVEEDSTLSKSWLALRFPEEQYTVSTLEELWSNVLGALADTLDEKGETEHGIDAQLDFLEQQPKAEREKLTLEYIQQWCHQHHRRLLLLMDSSDLLLSNLSHSNHSKKTDAGATQLWRLRDTLQNNPSFFWLGGSYQPLESEALYHDTFLDFFYNIELKPLTLKEMRSSMQELARVFGAGRGLMGEAAVAEITRSFDQHPERLNTLHRLTGGNLRTTVTLYELFAAGGANQVQADLNRLLDLMTPLYKSRIENLADQPRKILAHLFEYWAPISLAELAKISGLEKTSISPQLLRLEQEGLIEKTQLPATTRKGYQVTERFFNIWYLMRNAPRRLRMRLNYLVQFMSLWYSSEELTQMAIQQNSQYRKGHTMQLGDYEYSRALAATLSEHNTAKHQLEWTVFRTMRVQLEKQLPNLFDFDGEDQAFATSEDYLQRLEALPEKLSRLSFEVTKAELSLWVEKVLGSLSLSLEEKERIAKASSNLSQFQFTELNKVFINETQEFSGQLGTQAYLQVQTAIREGNYFPDYPDSKLAYRQLVACFSDQIKAFTFALSLFKQKHQDQWVEKTYRHLIKLDPSSAIPWNGLGNLLKDPLKRYKESEQAYRQAIEIDPKDALPWNGLGNLLQDHLKCYKESEQAYRQAIEIGPKYALPWNGLGNLLQSHLKRYKESEQAYRQAIEIDPKYALPWNGLGNLLQSHLKRYKESEQAYRQAIEIDPKVASPWNGLGYLLQNQLKRYEESEQAYRQAIEIDPKYATPWNNLGNLLINHLKRYKESEQAYRQAIEIDPKVALPWNGLGNLLKNHLKRYEESEQAYRQAIEIDPKDASPWNGLGNLLQTHLKPYKESEQAYRQSINLDEENVFAYANLARILLAQHKNENEVASLYRTTIEKAAKDAFNLLLQSHLYLDNKDLATQALNQLAQQANEGGTYAFFQIKEQCAECYSIGLGSQLANIMLKSPYSVFLQPFILALQSAEGDEAALLAAPVEITDMAKDVLLAINK